ncbi:tRNA-splicing endonuclease [Purpureocillium lavendulum]|uniref:tRNA-splicing endonuclease n=1 Tax=Purpureocillium lavendulum TaxID=1247861 RepID=A0AB34G0K8_9HYPO|nr:tRNA-splicing endonuclease [Purpureocillium lavendulum]
MADYNEDLAKWFEELQKLPAEHHLLCPKISNDDDEDYKTLEDPASGITVEEKKRRIEDGERRVEITYWNSLIFGFEKKDAGQWLNEFTTRLETCLRHCPGCVLNWHMKRKAHLQMFAERWNEESMVHIEYLLDKLDVARIEHNIGWAKSFIDRIEASGAVFKKAQFGEHLSEVLITVYEALCCVTYIGMTYFLFDMKVEDRLKWAHENWKTIDTASLTEEQFDWAVSGGLVKAIDDISRKDLTQATGEDYADIERFCRLRSLEVRPGNPHIYDLLFRHIQFCRSEGVLVAAIRVLTSLLIKSPKAFWDVIGDAKPNVIADLIFSSPVYKTLLRQSLENCWSGIDPKDPVPFDACEVLTHTLFKNLSKDASSFLDSNTRVTASSTTHLYASSAFNLVLENMDLILDSLKPPSGQHEGWTTLNVADAAKTVLHTARKLDMTMLFDEFHAIHDGQRIQSTVSRGSGAFWEYHVEIFDLSSDQPALAKDILSCLEPLVSVEEMRPEKSKKLAEPGENFNSTLKSATDVVIIVGLSVHDHSDLGEASMEVLKTWTKFCREIMELAEALIKEDGLIASATTGSKGEAEAMANVLRPAKDNFRGMENMIRLKDLYLVDTTVRVLRQILTRLRENNLEINSASRKLIMDACRAELLRALGHDEDDVQIVQISAASRTSSRTPEAGKERLKKQSKLDAWSKSAPTTGASSPSMQPGRTNRSDVLELSRSIESPVLKQIAARQAKTVEKSKTLDAKAISALKESRQREKAEKARRDAEAIAKARRLRGETVPGEGSGLHSLGLTGKDHSRSEIMVNSSDEESALSTGGEKTLDEHEKRKLQALRDKVRRPVKKTRQQRSVKEMRARLIPPMDRLHNTVLAWDIFHAGGEPPNGPKASEVATKYANPKSYQETFFPLLASEAWRFLEVTFTMPIVQNRERGVSEGDIILDFVEIIYRVASHSNPLSKDLVNGNVVHGVKITNMTTIEREYAALEKPSPILRPPGTGKTKTIVAMVGSLLSEQLSQQAAGVPIANPLRPTNGANAGRPKKLLVCAPSNAAVDELVLRLKAGVTTTSGKARQINVLRLGRSDAINSAVKDVTLDELVRVRLEGDTTKEKAKADREKLHADAARIKDELSELRPRLAEARGQEDRATANTLSRKFDELKSQQIHIGKLIDADKNSGNSIAREMDVRRRQVQQEILNSAHVLCATLSGSGHEMFRNLEVEFETVIIDEAAQCVELSALIPLNLFVRMQQNHPNSVHLLDMQYRMHPEISMFPSREFYEGQLRDGQDMLQLRQKPWHNNMLLGPYRFFDVEGVQEKGRKGQSLVNVKELEVAMQIYDTFSKKYRECDLNGKIGIITPYKAQLFELRNRFRARFGDNITDVIEFNTTDAFQDIRRMNVGEFWRKLIDDARSRDRSHPEAKKRPLDNIHPSQPGSKRVANDKSRSGLMAKFGQKPSRPAPIPKDPSAMSVLGMTPPERPPASLPNNSTAKPQKESNSNPLPTVSGAGNKAPDSSSSQALLRQDLQSCKGSFDYIVAGTLLKRSTKTPLNMAQPAIRRARAFSASSRREDAPHTCASDPNESPFILHRRSHTGWETSLTSDTLARIKPSSNLLSTDSSFYAGDLHDTLLLGEAARSRRARDDIQALVDFLKNQPPPPDNFMSIPYGDYGEDERGRWAKIRRIAKRRSKSMPREPQQIRLPDSAVSGTTIDAARSQYPVHHQDLSMGTPSKETVRTYINEKGVSFWTPDPDSYGRSHPLGGAYVRHLVKASLPIPFIRAWCQQPATVPANIMTTSLPWIFVCPSSRGIGLALTRRLLLATSLPVLATTRQTDTSVTKSSILDGLQAKRGGRGDDGQQGDLSWRLHVVRCDVTDESCIRQAAAAAAELFPPKTHHLQLACAIPGVLHAEKSPSQVQPEAALESFQVNALGPLLLAKHFCDFLPRRATPVPAAGEGREEDELLGGLPAHATWLSMAARVGSTTDNRAGGWYSYRASKAAVISLTRSLDLYLRARCDDKALAVAYHPGTVKTEFSREFWGGVPEGKLFSPEFAAEKMVAVIQGLKMGQRGRCWDWKGEEVPP